MKKLILVLGMLAGAVCAQSDTAVVYFTRAENTAGGPAVDTVTRASVLPGRDGTGVNAYLAGLIARETGADVLSLRVAEPYPQDFGALMDRNHSEQEGAAFPALRSVPDLKGYRRIFLGFPVWNMSVPRAVATLLKDADFSGKEVKLFCSHDGYGAGSSFDRVAAAIPSAQVDPEGLQIHSAELAKAADAVRSWVKTMPKVAAAGPVGGVRVVASVAGRQIEISLLDTPEARQFVRALPLTARMGEYGGREFYGPMPVEMQARGKGRYSFEDGTLTYCPTNHSIAIFYAQSARPSLTMAVYPMGRVVSDLSVFSQLPDTAEFTFRLKPGQTGGNAN